MATSKMRKAYVPTPLLPTWKHVPRCTAVIKHAYFQAMQVDNFLWACTESGHAVVDRLLTRFEVVRKEEGRLRFCGKQFDASGHDILLDVEDNTTKTTYI